MQQRGAEIATIGKSIIHKIKHFQFPNIRILIRLMLSLLKDFFSSSLCLFQKSDNPLRRTKRKVYIIAYYKMRWFPLKAWQWKCLSKQWERSITNKKLHRRLITVRGMLEMGTANSESICGLTDKPPTFQRESLRID